MADTSGNATGISILIFSSWCGFSNYFQYEVFQMATTSAIMTEEMEQLVASNLNLYLFENVWNETQRANRNNIIPQKLTKRPVVGTIMVYGENITLPNTSDPFYIYAVSKHTVVGLAWPKLIEYNWLTAEDLVNTYDILLDTYHTHGKMLHKKDVYIRDLPNREGYLVAINKKMVSKLVPFTEMSEIRLTVYYDYDIVNQINVHSYFVPVMDDSYRVRNEIWQKYQELKTVPVGSTIPTVLMFINGEEITPRDIGSIPLGGYVDLHIDRNVAVDIEVDLTAENGNPAFFSEMDKCYKNIVHIPRDCNPDQLIMTHNAMEIYVRKKLPEEDGTVKGLYLHRCADRSVTQITHQDIAIPSYILDAYRDYFGTSEITLRVYWRKHEGVNTLVRDKNYIDILYQSSHHDRQIIALLSGTYKYSNDLFFWKASYLEQSAYVKMMFDIPDIVTPANMSYYIDALGYYNTMFLLSKHVHRAMVSNWFDGYYVYGKPLVYRGFPCAAIMYADGLKIPADKINVVNSSDANVTVQVDNTYTPIGTNLTAVLYRDGVKNLYKITPKAGTTELTIPATEYDILEEVELDTTYTVRKFDNVATKGYKLFTKLAGNIVKRTLPDGRFQLIFGPQMYGRTFYIQPRPRTLYWSSSVASDNMDIQTKLENKDPLFFQLEKKVTYESVENVNEFCTKGERVLIWDTDCVMVYLNQRYLIRGIDFTLQDVLDNNGNVSMKVLVIQNQSYLRSEANTLEVYCTSAADENCESGHCAQRTTKVYDADSPVVVAGVITDNKTVLYHEDSSVVHVNGYYTEASISGNFITQKPSWTHHTWEGAQPIEIRTSVPYFVSDYLKKYHDNDDLERIEILNKYYFNVDLRKVPIEAFFQSHLIYSVYAATVMRDVLFGKNLALSYDPDNARMLQQLEAYKYLADIDLVTQGELDLNYVDVDPHYSVLVAPDIQYYELLHALMRACMPNDPVSSKKDTDITSP